VSLARTDIIICPMLTRATVPWGLPKAPRIPVWSLKTMTSLIYNPMPNHWGRHCPSYQNPTLYFNWLTILRYIPASTVIGAIGGASPKPGKWGGFCARKGILLVKILPHKTMIDTQKHLVTWPTYHVCYIMGSHRVTCHPHVRSAPGTNLPSRSWYSFPIQRMVGGWVDLSKCEHIACPRLLRDSEQIGLDRPGFEPAPSSRLVLSKRHEPTL
jgi:hypothetical protein